jgi:hypothetical protein
MDPDRWDQVAQDKWVLEDLAKWVLEDLAKWVLEDLDRWDQEAQDKWVQEVPDKWLPLTWYKVEVLLVDLIWAKVDLGKWAQLAGLFLDLQWVLEVLKIHKWFLVVLGPGIWVDLQVT